MPRPEPTWVYHFTRVEHLASIIQHGLVCDSRAHEPGVLQIEVGNTGIKEGRGRRAVPIDPGGVVADYVPFYYAPRSPMLFSIKSGNVPTYDRGCDRLVYLITSTQILRGKGLTVLGTDRHPLKSFATFVQDDAEITEMTDWPLMAAKYWSNTPEDPDRRERRQAECLVHEVVPFDAIGAIAAKSVAVQRAVDATLASMGVTWVKTTVRPDWYF
ncbi:MAG: DUF4433 domain-containing protein [Nocardioides sp.]